MKSYSGAFALFGFLAVLSYTAYAEVVPLRICPNSEAHPHINCTVHEVRVSPCEEAAEGKPCRQKRGHNATIEFDYTPNFSADTLEGRAYWSTEILDIPFLGMETNACQATQCPAVPGVKQTYHMDLYILKSYPVRVYDLKWRLKNPDDQECCFMFQIKIQK